MTWQIVNFWFQKWCDKKCIFDLYNSMILKEKFVWFHVFGPFDTFHGRAQKAELDRSQSGWHFWKRRTRAFWLLSFILFWLYSFQDGGICVFFLFHRQSFIQEIRSGAFVSHSVHETGEHGFWWEVFRSWGRFQWLVQEHVLQTEARGKFWDSELPGNAK